MYSKRRMSVFLSEFMALISVSISDYLKDIRVIAGLFTISTFLFSLYYPQHTDAALHIVRSEFIYVNGFLPTDQFTFNQARYYVYPPVFHILGAISKYFTGFYTIIPALSGGLSVYMTYNLISEWYNPRIGYLSGLALAVNPFFFIWSSRMYVGSTITLGFLTVFYFYSRYRASKERKYLYYSFALGGFLAAVKTYGPLASVIVFSHIIWSSRGKIPEKIMETYRPVFLGILVSLIWPIRNWIKVGNPLPKVLSRPFTVEAASESVSLMHLVLPAMNEFLKVVVMSLGVLPRTMVFDLDRIHYSLPYLWFILPAAVTAFIIYGFLDEKNNSFIWIWGLYVVIIYEIGRILSGAGLGLRLRHFITFIPAVSLFAARAYEKIQITPDYKQALAIVFILGIFAQMFTAATIRETNVDSAWEPLEKWIEENIEEDEVIYMPSLTRGLAYQLDRNYKVIKDSKKPGYINPRENFSEQIISKADWVVISDWRGQRRVEDIRRAEEKGILGKYAEINGYTKTPIGDLGKNWTIYKVVGDNN